MLDNSRLKNYNHCMRFLIQGFLLVVKANKLPSARPMRNISLFFKKGVAPPTYSRSTRCRSFGDFISKICRKDKVSQGISKKGCGTPNPFTVRLMPFFGVFISKVCRKNKVSGGISKKSTAITFGCINNNELNGPGSGFPILGGWHPQPIHSQPDVVLSEASSQKFVFFASFYKIFMVLVEINKKISFIENTRMEPAAAGRFLVGHWSLGGVAGEMMRHRCMDAWLHDCMDGTPGRNPKLHIPNPKECGTPVLLINQYQKNPPPITPIPHHPIFSKPINTQKTRIHISRVNNKL